MGTVDRSREFDRRFNPTSGRVRARWEGIAAAQRRGESMPPIKVFRVGDMHFVEDGHHRVSVAHAMGDGKIDAYVTEILTEVHLGEDTALGDLPLKGHERLFYERVPLPPEDRERIKLTRSTAYALLAEGVEAWGFRVMQGRREFMDREEVARTWFREDYLPIVEMLREAGLTGSGTETDAYATVVSLRYMLLRTHEWDEDVLERIQEEIRRPSWEDTEIRNLRRDLS